MEKILFFFISALVSTIFIFLRHRYNYWKRRDVPHLPPVFPLGNLNRLKSFSMLERINEIYTKFKGTSPIAGIYLFTKPGVVVLNLDLIRAILIRDFSVFPDRMQFTNAAHDPLSDHLFNMEAHKWRRMRSKLSPTFTSGKMKFMFPTVLAVADQFKDAVQAELTKSNSIEIRELLARFTIDVIGSCVFGIECNSLKRTDSEFYDNGRRAMEKPHQAMLIRLFLVTYTEFAQKLGLSAHEPKIMQFFVKVIQETVALREEKNIQRNDFLNLLIQLKNQTGSDGQPGLTINEIVAQAFVFFVAGFETSASTMAFSLFELAKQPEIQDKLRREILTVLEKHNNELSYEAMSEMTYLSQCVNETNRKYPALVTLTRKANQNYPIAGTRVVIEKGMPVLIPVHAIHYDPEIYSNPTKFDPDRFTPDNVQARDSISFLAFGDGPRNCIGLRFGRMQVRIGLITLLRSFKFSVCEKTPQEIPLNPKSFVLLPRDGLWLKVEAI